MAIIQKLISHDDLFLQSTNKILLNDIRVTDGSIKDMLFTTLTDEISLVPSCECGNLQGAYLIDKTCGVCHTLVTEPFNNTSPLLWVKSFTPELKFINPKFWLMLTTIISTKIDALRWLSDTSYNPGNASITLLALSEIIGGRSYMNVVNNIDKILDYLSNNSQFRTLAKSVKLSALKRVYKQDKDKVLSSYLPLINKNLFIMVSSKKSNYSSILLADIIDQALLAVSTANDQHKSKKQLANNTAKLISIGANLFKEYVKESVGRKNGIARKNLYGSRVNFTFRCVASSLPSSYNYDEVIVPWCIGMTTFRPHVLNKLYKLGLTPEEASALVFNYTNKYHPVLDKILQEIISESPNGYIPILVSRNPSLGQNSIQKLKLIKFNTEVDVQTIFISVLVAASFNLDFDGDECNISCLLDADLAKRAEVLKPHVNIVAMDNYKISGNLNMPKTSVITLMNYMHKEEPINKDCPIANELRNMG